MIFLVILFTIVAVFLLSVFFGAPYVPSLKKNLHALFDELMELKNTDLLVDIGSGDGVVLREASKRGIKSIGYEINPFLVLLSRVLSMNDKKVSVKFADFWRINLPKKTTVVYVFSVERDMVRLEKWLQRQVDKLGHSVYLVSLAFEVNNRKPQKNVGLYYLYIFQPLQSDKAQV